MAELKLQPTKILACLGRRFHGFTAVAELKLGLFVSYLAGSVVSTASPPWPN